MLRAISPLIVVLALLMATHQSDASELLDKRWNNVTNHAKKQAKAFFNAEVKLKQFFQYSSALEKRYVKYITAPEDQVKERRLNMTRRYDKDDILGELHVVVADGAVSMDSQFKGWILNGWSRKGNQGKFWAIFVGPFDKNNVIKFELELNSESECSPCEVRTASYFVLRDE